MTGATSKNREVLVAIILLISFISQQPVNSLGKRSFGERCAIGGHITSFFTPEGDKRACDSEMGLLCTGTYCACSRGRVWDNTDGGPRGCVGAVGSPCYGPSRNQQCVSNAYCQFAFCRCKSTFRPNGGHCVSTNYEGDQENSQAPRPSSSSSSNINFPELQQIFSDFMKPQQQNNHHVNIFNDNTENNNNNNFNNGIPPNENRENFNDRFHNEDNREGFNDRFHNGENVNNFNDRFHNTNNNGNYHDHQNSRDGSKGSRVLFDE